MAFRVTTEGHATVGDFWDAVYYLIASKTAWDMIHKLQQQKAQIDIMVKSTYLGFGNEGSHFRPPEWGRPHAEVYWWIYDWTDLGPKGFSNPAMALMHELGHVHQYLVEGRSMKRSTNWERVEHDNMETCEKPISRQLGLPRREDYREGRRMPNAQLYEGYGKGPERNVDPS